MNAHLIAPLNTRQKFTLTLAALTLAFAALVTPASAQNPPPTRLATINIVKVFDSLNEKISGDQEIENLAKDLTAQRQKMEDAAKKTEASMKDYKQDSPEFKAAAEELLKKAMEIQSFSAYQQQKILMERRIKTAALYRRMNQAIESYSAKNGIALVLVADELDLSNVRSNEELLSRITMRKVMYVHPTLDISEKVIEQMNIEFKMGK